MSKLYDIREALSKAITAEGIGWNADTILIKRQGSTMNDVVTAIATAQHGAVLHIGIARGKKTDDPDLEYEVEIPLTIIAKPKVRADQMPEEDLHEQLIDFVHDLKLSHLHPYAYRFRAGDFEDIDIETGGGTSYLGRQTIFSYKLSIPRKIKKP